MFDLNYFDSIRRDEQFNFTDKLKMDKTFFHNIKKETKYDKKKMNLYNIRNSCPFRNENILIEYLFEEIGQKALVNINKKNNKWFNNDL